MKLVAKEDRSRLLVVVEQGLDGDVEGASILAGFHDEVEDVVTDGAK